MQTKDEAGRKFFVCVHVEQNGRGFVVFDGVGDLNYVLCGDCYWNPPCFDQVKGGVFTEAEAVAKRWIPKSRAMQYLSFITNDTTGGQAVESPTKKLARILDDSGLNDEEQEFLWALFTRDYFRDRERGSRGEGVVAELGMSDLTEEEEILADRLTRRMFHDNETQT